MSDDKPKGDPSLIGVVAAFAAVYVIWGSTYFGIRVAIESLPGFVMAGIRFLTAGVVLYLWCRVRGAARPTLLNWRNTFIVGAFLLFAANGLVVWAEQQVPSGLTALLVAILPVWMVLIEWLRPGGNRPTISVIGGVLLGIVGVCVLISPKSMFTGKSVDTLGAIGLLMAGFLWAAGSIFSRHAKMPASPLLATSMQMLAGGALLILTSFFNGDWARFDSAQVTSRSWLALTYLIVFGSWIGFSAYVWLLRVTTPARVSTYAYVNPVVALLIGWRFGDEALDARTLIAACIIICAVAVITLTGPSRRPKVVEEPKHASDSTLESALPGQDVVAPLLESPTAECGRS